MKTSIVCLLCLATLGQPALRAQSASSFNRVLTDSLSAVSEASADQRSGLYIPKIPIDHARKCSKYSVMRNLGIGLLAGGIPTVLMARNMIREGTDEDYHFGDNTYALIGVVVSGIGSASMICGTVFTVTGGINAYRHCRKAEETYISLAVTSNGAGLVMTF